MPLDERGNPAPPGQRQGAAGGILKSRHKVDELHPLVRQHVLQGLGNEAVVVGLQCLIRRLIRAESLESAEVRGRLHGNGVPRRDKQLADGVQGPLGPARDEDRVRVCLDAARGKAIRQRRLERGESFGAVVLQGGGAETRENGFRERSHELKGEALRRGNAAGKRDHAGLRHDFQDLPDGACAHDPGARREQVFESHPPTLPLISANVYRGRSLPLLAELATFAATLGQKSIFVYAHLL